MRVAVAIRSHLPDLYPYEPVTRGIQATGDVVDPCTDEALVTWNNYGASASRAAQIKASGGLHVCMENGYMCRDRGYYIVSQDGFNGTGSNLPEKCPADRFEALNLSLESVKTNGNHILICGQRGGGYSKQAMQNDWPGKILRKLRAVTDRELLYRPHPARERLPDQVPENARVVSSEVPLQSLLQDCWAVVVFTSNAAVEALRLGIPVFYDGPTIAAARIACSDVTQIEKRVHFIENRYQFFCDLAYQQFNTEELERGVAWHAIKERL